MDAIKHIDHDFLRKFVRSHNKQTSTYIENPHLFVLDTTCVSGHQPTPIICGRRILVRRVGLPCLDLREPLLDFSLILASSGSCIGSKYIVAWCGFSLFARQPHLLITRDLLLDFSQASFFDVPLHDNFWRASKAGSKYDLRKILKNTVVSLQPKVAVTFVDNHE